MAEAVVVCVGMVVSVCVYIGLNRTNSNNALQMTEKKRNKWMENEMYRKKGSKKMY